MCGAKRLILSANGLLLLLNTHCQLISPKYHHPTVRRIDRVFSVHRTQKLRFTRVHYHPQCGLATADITALLANNECVTPKPMTGWCHGEDSGEFRAVLCDRK